MNTTTEQYTDKELKYFSWATLPLLGQDVETFTLFEYLPIAVSQTTLIIALPTWSQIQSRISLQDTILLHTTLHGAHKTYRKGKTVSIKYNEAFSSHVVELELQANSNTQINRSNRLAIDIKTAKDYIPDEKANYKEAINELLFDSLVIMQGISIYLSHLIPYYSRISNFSSKNFELFSDNILKDIEQKIKDKIKRLETCLNAIERCSENTKTINEHLDLSELKQIFESPIPLELLKLSLSSDEANSYIEAIKISEATIFENYNTISVLYCNS